MNLDLNGIIFANGAGIYTTLIIIVTTVFYFIGKSELILHVRDFSEYRRKKIDAEIRDKEQLINDNSLADYKNQINHHIKVAKLEKFLNFKNHDINLLKYIISCADSKRAIRLYKQCHYYLCKDEFGNIKLKDKWTDNVIEKYEMRGTVIYFFMTIVAGCSPLFFIILKRLEFINYTLSKGDIIFLFKLFVFMVLCAIFNLIQHYKPGIAKKFLELEKI